MTERLQRRRRDAEPSEQTLRALVVEDDPDYRVYIGAVVSRFGFSVTAAADGEEALARLQGGLAFDLILADYEMPRRDGFSLIQAVRNDPRRAETYAVLLTARDDQETKLTALGYGYDDVIGKSAGEMEIAAKLSAARRFLARQKRLDSTVRELYGLATRDELTGLFNRRHFFAETERLLLENIRVNIVLFDLDGFKTINDTYGHLAGDQILRDIGGVFLRSTRREDMIARYGGDEFVMLVRDLAPPEVELIAERLAAEIAQCEWSFGSSKVRLSASTGIACSSLLDVPTITHLLSAGDRDLYKNKWIVRHPDLDPSLYTYDAARDSQIVEMFDETLRLKRPRPE